jgi:hypothetical protein
LSEISGPAYNGGKPVAADFACKTIDPNNPTGPKIAAVFPGRYTQRLYKCSPMDLAGLTWKSISSKA